MYDVCILYCLRIRQLLKRGSRCLRIFRQPGAENVGMTLRTYLSSNKSSKMFRLAAFIALFAVATAFAPTGRVSTSSALKMSFEDALGAQPPLGFWDPLGLLEVSIYANIYSLLMFNVYT
jgi:hypothetical protein